MISFEDSYELNQGFIRGKGLESEISENVPNGPMKIVFRGALYQTIASTNCGTTVVHSALTRSSLSTKVLLPADCQLIFPRETSVCQRSI
ncbi:hypothetical protein B9Z55_025423 [Caenorhabditis nigoni]|uniref:Uncharacterized protein n=1 Tax=Caenorhabditis nigoni TaxID=1611254 RepID=A0A2G5SYS8_9PELO|nr:hypothetical protein B9Z55_025423 [Caenorhabditis nigoni]